jgi:hypothetical protein
MMKICLSNNDNVKKRSQSCNKNNSPTIVKKIFKIITKNGNIKVIPKKIIFPMMT